MWLEYLLLRDGSVELLCSPTLMKNKSIKGCFFNTRQKKTAVRETERGGKYVEETVIRLLDTVTVP